MILRLSAELKDSSFFIFVLDQNFFVSGHCIQKDPCLMPIVFLALFFHLQKYTNPSTLMGAKQWVRALLLFLLFEPSVFYNHRATQKSCLHLHHHPNDHHHHHNSHHTTFTSTFLLQTNQGQTARIKSLLLLPYHMPPVS